MKASGVDRKQNSLINQRVVLTVSGKMVRIMQSDEQQRKNLASMNGFTNGGEKTAHYRLDSAARTEIRRYHLPNQRESQIMNMSDAMQLSRRIRGEQA